MLLTPVIEIASQQVLLQWHRPSHHECISYLDFQRGGGPVSDAMPHIALRPIMLVLLAIYLVAGLGYAVAASNTMALRLTMATASVDMSGMDCDHQTPGKPCDLTAARCPSGCFAPSVDIPRLPVAAYPARATGAGELLGTRVGTGIDSLPQLPPPRSADIV
ncbi:hypothetical protein [Devosia sp.]|uniref:hypothetical protein n=1 Tax=Devosia sp. TaxID=1871048 RepID=UPI003F70E3A7